VQETRLVKIRLRCQFAYDDFSGKVVRSVVYLKQALVNV
jgi:hypothetical protein